MSVLLSQSGWPVALGMLMLEIALCLVLILLIRRLFRNIIGPTGCRLLWCVLILRCLVPVSIPTQYHPVAYLMSLGHEIVTDETTTGIETAAGNVSDRLDNTAIEQSAISQETTVSNDVIAENDVFQPVTYVPGCYWSGTIVFCIWLTGFVAFLAVAIARNRRVIRAACRSPEPVPPWMQTLFLECRDRLKLRAWPVLIVTQHVKTPSLIGAIRPRVLVPKTLLEVGRSGPDHRDVETDDAQRRSRRDRPTCDMTSMHHVFLHELTHLKQGDIWLSWCWTLVMALHWFNPLLWWVGRLVGFDCEAACDYRVLTWLEPERRAGYGRSLLEMMQKLNAPVVRSPGFSAVIEGSTNFERRLIMITNYRKRTMKQAVAGTVIPLLLLAVSLTTFAQQQHEPISVDKAKMIGYVEDFFLHNDRDITMRKSLEWGDVATDEQGHSTIRYKFEALIRDKDRQILCEDFTFDKDGKFVASQKVDGFPQEPEKPDTSTKEGMQKLVEKFFSQNYRDITKRTTLEWGEPATTFQGNRAIRYKYEATIWDKEVITQNKMFFFTKDGEFVSVGEVSTGMPDGHMNYVIEKDASKTDDESKKSLEDMLKLQKDLFVLKRQKIQFEDALFRFRMGDDSRLKTKKEELDEKLRNATESEKIQSINDFNDFVNTTENDLKLAINGLDKQIKETENELEYAKSVAQLKRDFGPLTQAKPK